MIGLLEWLPGFCVHQFHLFIRSAGNVSVNAFMGSNSQISNDPDTMLSFILFTHAICVKFSRMFDRRCGTCNINSNTVNCSIYKSDAIFKNFDKVEGCGQVRKYLCQVRCKSEANRSIGGESDANPRKIQGTFCLLSRSDFTE